MHNHSAEIALSALAARQHGVVSLAQLRGLGLNDDAVLRRCRNRRLHRVHRGVYAVGHTAVGERGRELAAVLACGPQAVLSHRSAARLWGLVASAPKIEVTCERGRPPDGRVLDHRSSLTGADRARIQRVPVTSVARTLVDLADVLGERRLGDAIHEAEVRRLFDLNQTDAVLARLSGRRGRHRLERVLSAWRPRPFTRSEAERRFLELCERHELPLPEANASVAGHEIDFLWPEHGLAAEVDGVATHLTRTAFERDRRKDRQLAAMGIQVVRVTWSDLEDAPGALAAQLAGILPC
jgi:hypothetical protein